MPLLPGCPYVFWHPKSQTRWHNARKGFNKAREDANLDWLIIKDLRRHYGIVLSENGAEMHEEIIQAMLGHPKSQTRSQRSQGVQQSTRGRQPGLAHHQGSPSPLRNRSLREWGRDACHPSYAWAFLSHNYPGTLGTLLPTLCCSKSFPGSPREEKGRTHGETQICLKTSTMSKLLLM